MEDNQPDRVGVLLRAANLTGGAREEMYGPPTVSMKHAADIFNAVTGNTLSARDAAIFLGCVKMARRYQNPLHTDSYDDGAAYTAIEYECALEECNRR